ncbi:hypothetical protein B0H10DRAFT_1941764 [Mycena sp. CBHHK59/15]|nr:hypothetical protein B0H10DRAFT_1941764 [Mycena sp. CBHHK59/15]
MLAGGGRDRGIEGFGNKQQCWEDAKTWEVQLQASSQSLAEGIAGIHLHVCANTTSRSSRSRAKEGAKKASGMRIRDKGYEERVGRHLEDLKTVLEVLEGMWARGGNQDESNTADQITMWHIMVQLTSSTLISSSVEGVQR